MAFYNGYNSLSFFINALVRSMAWLTTKQMSDKYDINQNTLRMFYLKVKEDENLVRKVDDSLIYNETSLIRIKKIRCRIWNANHEYYWFIKNEIGLTDLRQAKILGEYYNSSYNSWMIYIYSRMWNLVHDKSVLDIKINKFMRGYCEWAEEFIIDYLKNKKK